MHHALHWLQWSSSSHIVLSCDLEPNMCFCNTDTWDFCDKHSLDYMIFLDLLCDFKLWFCELVIMIHDSYSSKTSHAHYTHVTARMHEHTVHDLLFYFRYSSLYCQTCWFFLFWCPISNVTIFSCLYFCCSFLSCVHLLVQFWRTYIIFQYSYLSNVRGNINHNLRFFH